MLVRTVATRHPGHVDLLQPAVRSFQGRAHRAFCLLQRHKLCSPVHFLPTGVQPFAEQSLVVILPQDQQKGIGAKVAPDAPQGRPRGALPLAQRLAALARCPRSIACSAIPSPA